MLMVALVGLTAGLIVLSGSNRRLDAANNSLNEINTAMERAVAAEKQERNRAEEGKQIAQAVWRFLQFDLIKQADPQEQADRLLQIGGNAAEAHESPTIKELLQRAARGVTPVKIETKFPSQRLVQAAILNTIGDTFRAVDDHAKALAHLTRALDLYERHLDAHHLQTLTSLHNLAGAYQDPASCRRRSAASSR
jgi:hypothetical protein